MKTTLRAGLTHEFRYQVPENKTVPHLYPESEAFRAMPPVFATGFMVGLIEWACIDAIQPHLDAGEQSVGTDLRLTHTAATPPGLTVTVKVTLDRVEGRKLAFSITAHDGVDTISQGTHERFVIDTQRFLRKVQEKAVAAGGVAGRQ
ncbi:MAG TPA: thioesterase family protein [Anaeromyxobacteraceae bacterium]|jgi:fluoroacetyl-CoA thioesterase|nr:thioesterase family protein [Anaeromyxobacteraceae bacterium]